MVFGGIAGVVSSEQAEIDDHGQVPSINAKSNEVADMQDIYRRTLAASWSSRVGDTPADSLIESLFSGNSTLSSEAQSGRAVRTEDGHEILLNDADSGRMGSADRLSPGSDKRSRSSPSNSLRNGDVGPDFTPAAGRSLKRGSIQQQLYGKSKGKALKSRNPSHELSEFDVREDLRSWEVSTRE